jgi:hypothetical protein
MKVETGGFLPTVIVLVLDFGGRASLTREDTTTSEKLQLNVILKAILSHAWRKMPRSRNALVKCKVSSAV